MRQEVTEIRREVTFRLEEAEPVQLEYGKLIFRPEKATVVTVAGIFLRLEVEGPRLLKGGARGQTSHSRIWWESDRRRGGLPDWTEDLIKAAEEVR